MRQLLELHILQHFAPSNLNRDDTGSPKDAFFGGERRARISSQCLKRAARTYFRAETPLDKANLAVRTKRVTEALAEALVPFGHSPEDAARAAEAALGGLKLTVAEGKSQYLLFLGRQEVTRIAKAIHDHWTALIGPARAEANGKARSGKDAKKTAKAAVPPELVKVMAEALDGGKAVDVALFGRMLADLPEKNTDAAAQVAHAISTHKVDREFDFYTAVDDLKPEDTAGADMLGTIEFNSACYYRYAAVDLAKLVENLQGDAQLALKSVEAFLRASIYAAPTGKQNTFAAHNPPGFIAFTVREHASPRSLANAFERAVRPGEAGLTAASATALAKEWAKLEHVFGQGGQTVYVNATEGDVQELPGEAVPTVEALMQRTMQYVQALVVA